MVKFGIKFNDNQFGFIFILFLIRSIIIQLEAESFIEIFIVLVELNVMEPNSLLLQEVF